jgi:methyltransferase
MFEPVLNWPIEIGAPQIAVFVLLAQRLAEEIHAQRNTRRLLKEGAREVGKAFYPVVPVVHLGWIAALFFLVPPAAPLLWPLVALWAVLQIARYWIIGSLGRYWTHRSITLDSAPAVRSGPYGMVRHPNYLIVFTEVLVISSSFQAWWLAIAGGLAHGAMLLTRIRIEDKALAARRG